MNPFTLKLHIFDHVSDDLSRLGYLNFLEVLASHDFNYATENIY